MTSETLKPCPFCGGKACEGSGPRSDNYAFVNCAECLASTDILLAKEWQHTPQEARERWNARALAPALDRVIAEVEMRMDNDNGPYIEPDWYSCLNVLRDLRALRAADTAPETQDE